MRGRAEARGVDKASRWCRSRFRALTFSKRGRGRAEARGVDKTSRWCRSRFRALTFSKGMAGLCGEHYRSQMLGRVG